MLRYPLHLPAALLVILSILITACSSGQASDDTRSVRPTSELVLPTIDSADKMVPVIAASELEVGQNRLPIGVLRDGSPINDPDLRLHLRLFYLDGDERDTVQSETDAVYRGEGLPWALYVAHPQMDRAGTWGLEIAIPQEQGEPHVNRIRVEVLDETQSPALGSRAIPSKNLTIHDVPNLEELTSDVDPDPDFYQMTIADALDERKPVVVMFATPGYCMTAVCAPNMGVMRQLKDEFKSQITFIHIEVYPYPFDEAFAEIRFVEAMQEWNLTTEPWTFLVDSDGIIRAKYEGGITIAEMRPALQHLVDGTDITAATTPLPAEATTTQPDDAATTQPPTDRVFPTPTDVRPGEVFSRW